MDHRKRIIVAAGSLLLFCSSCRAEVRERAYGEAMAVHFSDNMAQSTIRYGEASAQAAAPQPALLPEALRLQSGKALYTGHLSVLMVSGEPVNTLLQLTAEQWLTPDCTLLFTPENAAVMLAKQEAPEDQYRQAFATGAIPRYDTADILGMLQNGAAIAPIPCYEDGVFTLALWDTVSTHGSLTSVACRGVALAENDWEQFRFIADTQACTITKCRLLRRVTETEDGLFLELECHARCDPSGTAAQTAVEGYLTAALQESLQHGADLFFWQETAIRDGIAWAAQAAPEQWRTALQQAEFRVSISLS